MNAEALTPPPLKKLPVTVLSADRYRDGRKSPGVGNLAQPFSRVGMMVWQRDEETSMTEEERLQQLQEAYMNDQQQAFFHELLLKQRQELQETFEKHLRQH